MAIILHNYVNHAERFCWMCFIVTDREPALTMGLSVMTAFFASIYCDSYLYISTYKTRKLHHIENSTYWITCICTNKPYLFNATSSYYVACWLPATVHCIEFQRKITSTQVSFHIYSVLWKSGLAFEIGCI